MPEKRDTSLFTRAQSWTVDLWAQATDRWSNRSGQDRNYRQYAINPALRDLMRRLFPNGIARIIELGCGDGSLLEEETVAQSIASGGYYLGIDRSEELLTLASSRRDNPRVSFLKADITDLVTTPALVPDDSCATCLLSIMAIQEIPDISALLEAVSKILPQNGTAVFITVRPSFGSWLFENGHIPVEKSLEPDKTDDDRPWRWAGRYPIVDEPNEAFYLPYFHRENADYRRHFQKHGLVVDDVIDIPADTAALHRLTEQKISPFFPYDRNLYWPSIGEHPSSVAFVVKHEGSVTKTMNRLTSVTSKTSRYDDLRDRFMAILDSPSSGYRTQRYDSPALYDDERVSYIIPPVTMVEDRNNWKPASVYVVKEGVVAVGRVFYTKTSGEYLIEELVLRRGDIFGEFEVPLSLFESEDMWSTVFPPRFNMTYGAWASGPALNWAMAYPRRIPRDTVDRENAKAAVHPFYIKSKNLRPYTSAEVIVVPIERFEETVRNNQDAMSWFLMNVLKKNRLYFEPPTPGYGRSASALIARLVIRLLAHRIRLDIVVREKIGQKTTCRTFIGPSEWFKSGLSPYMNDMKELIRSSGGQAKTVHSLPLFPPELAEIIDVAVHYPVKDLDDAMLSAMGCAPAEDRRDNRYGLLTGIRIECRDIESFRKYLLEKGE